MSSLPTLGHQSSSGGIPGPLMALDGVPHSPVPPGDTGRRAQGSRMAGPPQQGAVLPICQLRVPQSTDVKPAGTGTAQPHASCTQESGWPGGLVGNAGTLRRARPSLSLQLENVRQGVGGLPPGIPTPSPHLWAPKGCCFSPARESGQWAELGSRSSSKEKHPALATRNQEASAPRPAAQLSGPSSSTPEGCGFDSQSRHLPRLRVGVRVGGN